MTIKLPSVVNITSSSFYISDHPYYRVYIKEPYKNMKILTSDDYDIDTYHVYDGYDVPVIKYPSIAKLIKALK